MELRRKQLFEYSLMTLTFRNISFLHLAKNATQSLTKCFIVVVRENRCAFTHWHIGTCQACKLQLPKKHTHTITSAILG